MSSTDMIVVVSIGSATLSAANPTSWSPPALTPVRLLVLVS